MTHGRDRGPPDCELWANTFGPRIIKKHGYSENKLVSTERKYTGQKSALVGPERNVGRTGEEIAGAADSQRLY